MTEIIVRICLHLACFAIAWYALGSIDIARYIKQGHTKQAQILMFLLSMALGYLAAQFLLAIAFRYYVY